MKTVLTVVQILQALIRFDTTNPPGQELESARWVATLLQSEGISSEMIQGAPGRGNLIARIPGDGSGGSLILLGHLDVVPADPKEWDLPPFEGVVRDERVWGRGAIDMKGMVAMEIAAFLRLKREGFPLKGDVILVLVADEETGGQWGAKFLVEKHWDKVAGNYLLNEGSIGIQKYGVRLYPIQVAEKGVAWLQLTARGTSGHGSMPTADNAVLKIAEAVALLGHYEFPITPSPIVSELLQKIASHRPFWERLGGRYFYDPLLGPLVRGIARKRLAGDKRMNALLSHTISPTLLEAGYKANVIPAEAFATVDVRIMPGETPEGIRLKIQQLVGEEIEVELLLSSHPNSSERGGRFYEVIEESIRAHDPEAVVAPTISPGATDSRFFRPKGVQAFGLIPVVLSEEEFQGVHGKNERIPVEGLERGVQIIYDIVTRMQRR